METKVKEGFLYYPITTTTTSYFSSLFIFRNFAKTTSSKTWTKKYFALYSHSPEGIPRLEEKSTDPRKLVIPLNECIKIWTPSNSLIEIVTKDGAEYTLKTATIGIEEETSEWLFALQKVAFNIMQEKEEENQLYSGFNEDETQYLVSVIASPVKSLLEYPNYRLQLTPEAILLLPVLGNDTAAIFTWHLRDIRRYGSSAETFTLEAGRRCASGPGLFSFATSKGTQLFSMLSAMLRDLMQRDKSLKGGCLEEVKSPKPPKPPRKTGLFHHGSSYSLSLTPPPSPCQGGNIFPSMTASDSPSPSTCSSNQDMDTCPDYENIVTLSVSPYNISRPCLTPGGAVKSNPLRTPHADLTMATTLVCDPSNYSSTMTTAPPAHYLQNEVEYAVVLKDKRK
ncbi:Docking protein 3 [Halotydeus destructor]|nr:Docking protein 3 [Halotydeus destructor]